MWSVLVSSVGVSTNYGIHRKHHVLFLRLFEVPLQPYQLRRSWLSLVISTRELVRNMAYGMQLAAKVNCNDLFLLQLCSEFDLVVSNTFYHQKREHKVKWTHPRPKHGHMIDFILTRKSDMRDTCNVRVLRSADSDTGHNLVRGKF